MHSVYGDWYLIGQNFRRSQKCMNLFSYTSSFFSNITAWISSVKLSIDIFLTNKIYSIIIAWISFLSTYNLLGRMFRRFHKSINLLYAPTHFLSRLLVASFNKSSLNWQFSASKWLFHNNIFDYSSRIGSFLDRWSRKVHMDISFLKKIQTCSSSELLAAFLPSRVNRHFPLVNSYSIFKFCVWAVETETLWAWFANNCIFV